METSTLVMLVALPVAVAVRERLRVVALLRPAAVGRLGVLLLRMRVGRLVDRVKLKDVEVLVFPAMSVAVAV